MTVRVKKTPKTLQLAAVVLSGFTLTGCATFGSAPVYGEIPDCPRLVPPFLLEDVPGVPIPESEEAEPWMHGFIGMIGQLEKANERKNAVQHINKTCLDMHREQLNRSKRGWLGRLFG